MVVVMIPGLGFLYSGLARRKSALTMIWVCMASFSVITFQWYLWGYSLAFSAQGTSGFIGDLNHFGLINTLGAPSPGSPLIPELLYSFYQVSASAFAEVRWVLINMYSYNFALPQLLSSQVPSLSEVACFRLWYLYSAGQHSSTAPSPAGHGTSTAGALGTVSWTMLAAGPSKSVLACLLSHIPWF